MLIRNIESKVFILVIAINFNMFSNNLNTYIDKDLNFKFKYSDDIDIKFKEIDFMKDFEYLKSFQGKYNINIRKNKIDKLKERFDVSDYYIKINENLEFREEQLKMYKNKGLFKYFSYDNQIIGIIKMTFDHGSASWQYSKSLTFKLNDSYVSIVVSFVDVLFEIPAECPDFFYREIVEDGGKTFEADYIWKEPLPENYGKFYALIKNKSDKAPKELIKLEEYFDDIISSFEITDKTTGNYFTPTVERLSFREGSSFNYKRIRMLTKGEKLELLEKGKTETIGDAKGTWAKGRTEQGEVGWCFDAYLEEMGE